MFSIGELVRSLLYGTGRTRRRKRDSRRVEGKNPNNLQEQIVTAQLIVIPVKQPTEGL